MYPPRVLSLLVLTASVAKAAYLNPDRMPRDLVREVELEARADDDTPASSTGDNILSNLIPSATEKTTAKTTDQPKTTEKTTDKPAETTKDQTTAKPTTTEKTTDKPAETTKEPTTDDSKPTSPGQSSPTPTDTPNNNDSGDGGNGSSPTPTTPSSGNGSGSGDDPSITNAPSVIVETKTTIITTTNEAGQEVALTTTTRTTTTPGLNDDGDSDAEEGMSPSTRKTVIGVVVGIGGAVALGAMGFVAWRVWGRKKHVEESDGLMSYDPNHQRSLEKLDIVSNAGGSVGSHPSAARNPFQSTLENYHRPTQVNQSANF